MRVSMTIAIVALALCVSAGARAGEVEVLQQAAAALHDGKALQAALAYYQVEESAMVAADREQAEVGLAQALEKLGLGYPAFYYYGQIVKAGPAHAGYFDALEGVVRLTQASGDEVLGPNLLERAWNPQFERLPPATLAQVDEILGLQAWRAGKYDDAARFLRSVPKGSPAWPRALYLTGLLQQRTDPQAALSSFRAILALDDGSAPGLPALKELTHLALGRTLFGLHQYRDAAREYDQLPRFSRHWDEALFEGAYAELRDGDPGGALGKLHSLHSPHLSDEFAPESENLAAIIYIQRCLYPQTREALARFDRVYLPMEKQVKAVLDANPPFEELSRMLEPGDTRLPVAVKRHLAKNERVAAMVGYLAGLDAQAARVRGDDALAKTALGEDLVDLIARQKALMEQVTGKFLRGRLADLDHLIDVLDGDKEIIAFETAKGEKEMLETGYAAARTLEGQRLFRPEMPKSGHEYWGFDGEYWPDEIGYYRYTLKDACPKPQGGGK